MNELHCSHGQADQARNPALLHLMKRLLEQINEVGDPLSTHF